MPSKQLLIPQPGGQSTKPPISYPQLTELTRNPASTCSAVEMNCFLFFPTPSTSYIYYDLSPYSVPIPYNHIHQEMHLEHASPVRRESFEQPATNSSSSHTFAKILHNEYTTPNLTSPSRTALPHQRTRPPRRAWPLASSHSLSQAHPMLPALGLCRNL